MTLMDARPGVILCDPANPCTKINFVNYTSSGPFLVEKSYECHNAVGTISGHVDPAPACLSMRQV